MYISYFQANFKQLNVYSKKGENYQFQGLASINMSKIKAVEQTNSAVEMIEQVKTEITENQPGSNSFKIYSNMYQNTYHNKKNSEIT